MSLSAPVTVQVREYVNPAIGVATPASTRTVMGGSGYYTNNGHAMHSQYLIHQPSVHARDMQYNCSLCVCPSVCPD